MKTFKHRYDRSIVAFQMYASMDTYVIKSDDTVIFKSIPKQEIEDNPNWIMIEDYENYSEKELLRAAVEIMSKIMYYCDWKAETSAERTLTGIMNHLGYWPWDSEEQMIALTKDHKPLYDKFRDFNV